MLDRRYRAVLWLGMLVVASLLFLCVANPAPAPTPVNYLLIGYILGTLYGQTTLAAAWAALGPFPLVWRLPGSLAWIAALIVSVAISLANELLETIAVLTGCALAQWLLFLAAGTLVRPEASAS